MPGDRSITLNESPWPGNLNSQESDRSGIVASGSSRQEITRERLPHGSEEVVTVGAQAQSGRTPLGQMSGPVWKAGPFEEAEGAQRGGNRAHSRIVPAGRRINTLSTSCGSGNDRTEHDGSGSGWRWGAGSDSGRLPHLGAKSKATPSANHVLQERQTEGKEARVGEGNYNEESDLENEKGGGGGGGGGGGYLKKRMGMRKGKKTKRFRAGQKFRALCKISRRRQISRKCQISRRRQISRTMRNFAQLAKFHVNGSPLCIIPSYSTLPRINSPAG